MKVIQSKRGSKITPRIPESPGLSKVDDESYQNILDAASDLGSETKSNNPGCTSFDILDDISCTDSDIHTQNFRVEIDEQKSSF